MLSHQYNLVCNGRSSVLQYVMSLLNPQPTENEMNIIRRIEVIVFLPYISLSLAEMTGNPKIY
jgi:hypothetical protein